MKVSRPQCALAFGIYEMTLDQLEARLPNSMAPDRDKIHVSPVRFLRTAPISTASLISVMRLPNPLQLSLIFSSLTLDSPPQKEAGVALHPNGISTKCLDVQGAALKNGTPVQM